MGFPQAKGLDKIRRTAKTGNGKESYAKGAKEGAKDAEEFFGL